MSPIKNDQELTNYILEISKNSRNLDRLFREEMEGSLFCAAMLIEESAKKMMERLNDLRYRNPARKT